MWLVAAAAFPDAAYPDARLFKDQKIPENIYNIYTCYHTRTDVEVAGDKKQFWTSNRICTHREHENTACVKYRGVCICECLYVRAYVCKCSKSIEVDLDNVLLQFVLPLHKLRFDSPLFFVI